MLLPATLPCPAAASAVQPLFAWKAFDELSAAELYSALQLRSEVFVAEQGRAYPEVDGADPAARHLLALSAADGLAGYLRVLPPDSTGAAELGRVVVRPAARGGGLGRRLVGVTAAWISRRYQNGTKQRGRGHIAQPSVSTRTVQTPLGASRTRCTSSGS